MTKKLAFLLAALLAVNCLTGCTGQELSDESTQVDKQIVSVTEEAQTDGKTLVIDTTVEVPNLSSLKKITLCFDKDSLDKMVKELAHSQYPDLKEKTMDTERRWSVETQEQLLFSLSFTDKGFEAGRTYYLDVLRDLNGQNMGDDALMYWTPYYMTEHIPDKLTMTSKEASTSFAEFLEQYSCFDYKPWNVVAVNCRNEPDSSGYYQAKMQPQFEGMPVYGHGALNISACMSAEGVFTFQGIMVLKEQSRENAGASMTLEEAIEQFKVDFAETPQGNIVNVDRITVGYIADSHYSGNWTLSPAWIFEYSATHPKPDSQEEETYYFTCAYRMDSGSLFTFD